MRRHVTAEGHDQIGLEVHQFGRKRGKPLGPALRIAVFQHYGFSSDMSERGQSVDEQINRIDLG